MTNHPNRARGRPRDPNAKVHLTLRVRPDLFERITARDDWRAAVEDMLARAFG